MTARRQCTAKSTTTGQRCEKAPIKGGVVCPTHGGSAPMVVAAARVRAEVLNWGLGDVCADPGEVLLRLVTQSSHRCELYARLLGEAYEAAERLRAAEALPDRDLLAAETARMDFDRVMNQGGVSALVGHKYAGTQTSGVIATGEAIRGLAELEANERDRCASFATKAIAAGLAERQVRLAERQGALLAGVIQAILGDLGLSAAQQALVPTVVPNRLREILGGAA